MEVGAVKQAFNNEAIHLKKKLNQAKIHIIHKLTRKAKTLTQKKCPESIQNKLKRKAETAVREVLELKKVTPKDLAKFAVSHKGKLADYLNKPIIDKNRACARLLLHYVLEDKYNFLRETFTNIAIDDLLLSREERRKIKKDKIEEKQNKRKKSSTRTSESGDWSVEDIKPEISKPNNNNNNKINKLGSNSGSEGEITGKHASDQVNENVSKEECNNDVDDSSCISDEDSNTQAVSKNKNIKSKENGKNIDNENRNSLISNIEVEESDDESNKSDEELYANKSDSENAKEHGDNEEPKFKKVKEGNHIVDYKNAMEDSDDDDSNKSDEELSANESESNNEENSDNEVEPKFIKLKKENNIVNSKSNANRTKNKNQSLKNNKKLQEKIMKKKFGKDEKVEVGKINKIADPFFLTSSGENYMSLVEPRPPDEVKEEHRQGNRKSRRAALFGHELKRPYRSDSNRFNNYKENKSEINKHDTSWLSRNEYKKDKFNNKKDFRNENNNSKSFDNSKESKSDVPEKLHPSWEAKKKQSGLLPFKGKKIVFE